MAKAKQEEVLTQDKVLFTVDGFKVMEGGIYQVTGRVDESLPEALQKEGVSKIPFPGNKDIFNCAYDSYRQAYDTGFYEGSACYRGWGERELKEELQKRIDNVKKPFEAIRGEGTLDHNTDIGKAFLDDYIVKYEIKDTFNMDDPIDRFNLYLALKDKRVVTPETVGNPEYEGAYLGIRSRENIVDEVLTRDLSILDAQVEFVNLVKGTPKDRMLAVDYFCYLDQLRTSVFANDWLMYSFKKWIEKEAGNIGRYNNLTLRAKDEEFRDEMSIHRMLVFLESQQVVSRSKNGISFKGNHIGFDLKQIAHRVIEDKDLINLRSDIMNEYDRIFAEKE